MTEESPLLPQNVRSMDVEWRNLRSMLLMFGRRWGFVNLMTFLQNLQSTINLKLIEEVRD